MAESRPAPFHFECQRSGNCCRIGHGRVRVREQELEAMALELRIPLDAFLRNHVQGHGDGDFSLRLAADGRCSMLEGARHCRIYGARPEPCRTFPYWPRLLQEEEALRFAAGYCPGIQRFPTMELWQEVAPIALELSSAPIPSKRPCAHDSSPTLEDLCPGATDPAAIRWGNSLEVDLYLAGAVDPRPADPLLRQEYGLQLQQLAEAYDYPWSCAPWEALLGLRREGWMRLGGLPRLP